MHYVILGFWLRKALCVNARIQKSKSQTGGEFLSLSREVSPANENQKADHDAPHDAKRHSRISHGT
jgi:hypothetical protein